MRAKRLGGVMTRKRLDDQTYDVHLDTRNETP